MNLLLGGGLLGGGLGGGLDKLTGEGEKQGEGAKTETGEDPEVVQARLEAEERRKDKHRKIEEDREKMRQGIRDKYQIKKKEDEMAAMMQDCEGRIGAAKRKTPEELAKEAQEQEDSLMGQLGLGGMLDKAKTTMSGVTSVVKGFLPFGK